MRALLYIHTTIAHASRCTGVVDMDQVVDELACAIVAMVDSLWLNVTIAQATFIKLSIWLNVTSIWLNVYSSYRACKLIHQLRRSRRLNRSRVRHQR